jgi:hypothetical protein
MRLRQYASTVGWNPSSSSGSPQAIFQAMSRRSELATSRSLKPLQRLQHQDAGDHLGWDRWVAPTLTGQIRERLGRK